MASPAAPVPSEVFEDYQPPSGRKHSELTEQQQAASKRIVELELRAAFEQELSAEQAGEYNSLQRGAGLTPLARKSNRDWVVKLDNQLKQGCGFGLSNFVPKRRCAMLQQGQERQGGDRWPAGAAKLYPHP